MSRRIEKEEVVFVKEEGKGSKRKISAVAAIIIMVFLFIVLASCMAFRGVEVLTGTTMFALGIDLANMIGSFVIVICCITDKAFYSDGTDEPLYFICLWLLNYVTCLCDAITWIADGHALFSTALYATSLLGFFFSPMMIIVMWYYLRTQLEINETLRRTITVSINIVALIADINAIVNPLFDQLFYVDQYGVYHEGTLWFTPYIIAAVMILLILIGILASKNLGKMKIGLTILMLLPLAMSAIVVNDSFVTIGVATTIILLFMYGLMYARRGVTIATKDAEIESRKTAVLSAQIKPHFINNCMQVIMNLQEEDPPKALEAMGVFATYVRDSMDNINKVDLVSFKEEMAFADKYLYLQELRFVNRFQVEKDIKVEDFEIPAFTVQPLVENAVKYGFAGRKDTGTIYIGTKRTDDGYRIIISDDGNGFDESKISKDRSHVGLYNVQERVRKLTGGEVFIESIIDRGTRIVIDIPFERTNWRDKDE